MSVREVHLVSSIGCGDWLVLTTSRSNRHDESYLDSPGLSIGNGKGEHSKRKKNLREKEKRKSFLSL